MKGVVFNVIEDVVCEAISADAWDDVIKLAGVEGAYTSLGSYPEQEFAALVRSIGQVAGLSSAETLRLTGRLGFKYLARRAPHVLEGITDWRSVLTSLDDIIHPEVRKIYADAAVPGFSAVEDGGDVVVEYSSPRRLCALADGLALGAGEWHGHTLTVQHLTCVHDGDESCTMRVSEAAPTNGRE